MRGAACHAPRAGEGGAELPLSHFIRRAGDCFFSTSTAALTAEEIIAGTWRVHAEDGALELAIPTH